MKISFLALFLVLQSLCLSKAFAEDVCTNRMVTHLEEINTSEILLKELAKNSKEISAYEITLMQKSMTSRYVSLKRFQDFFNDEANNCSPKVLASAVAIFDYTAVGASVFNNKALRRVFMGLIKFKPYQLATYVDDYKKHTSNENINQVLDQLNEAGVKLPEGISIHTSPLEYDPNLYALSDVVIKGTTSIVAGAARVWGFISDHLKWRQGRIKNNDEAVKILKSNLKPLDLVFETRKFTLSNFTIPGHWGHVGIWLGTKEELIELGIWDQPSFASFKPYVERGLNIVEVRKEGLGFQGIETFINLDEIAVTRIKDIHSRAVSVFEELSGQIDKKYDFKFDARSADKITCAELIAFSYGDIKWPVSKTLFQYSLRPDDLALLTLDNNSPAEFVLYFKGLKKKEGGGFKNMSFDDWSKLYKGKNHLTPEELAFELEKKAQQEKDRLEREEFNKLYSGA